MPIELHAVVENGHVSASVTSSFDHGDVVLTSEESAAVSAIFSAAGPLAASLHCERRSDAYLSIVGPEYGDDFCRLKATARSLWFSLDLTARDVSGDPRLSCVKNKRQRHWKIPLDSIDDIAAYGDLVLLSLESTSLKP